MKKQLIEIENAVKKICKNPETDDHADILKLYGVIQGQDVLYKKAILDNKTLFDISLMKYDLELDDGVEHEIYKDDLMDDYVEPDYRLPEIGDDNDV